MTDSFTNEHAKTAEIDQVAVREVTIERVREGLGFLALPTVGVVVMHALRPGTATEAAAAAVGVALSIGGIVRSEKKKQSEREDTPWRM